MAHNLTQLFIKTTLKRLDEIDARLKETERHVFDILAGMQITEMSMQQHSEGYIEATAVNKQRKG